MRYLGRGRRRPPALHGDRARAHSGARTGAGDHTRTHSGACTGARTGPGPDDRTRTHPDARIRIRIRIRDRLRDDRGAVLLEFTGFLPTLLLVGLAVVQLGLVGYSFQQAASGARAAARAEALEPGAGPGAADAAMSAWYDPQVAVGGADLVRADVTVDIPTLIPFVDLGWTATRSVTMPADED